MKRFVPLLLAIAPWATAESVIDFSKLPKCAQEKCTVLQAADTGCVPPAAPKTEQGIYQSCVCQSSLLTTLHASGSICQTAGCSADDATAISQYYIALCAGPVVEPPAATTTGTTLTTTTTTAPTSGSTAGVGGATDNGEVSSSSKDESWIEGHWRWVVMVVVIAVAMAFFWIGGIYLRRHFEKKKDAKRANLAAKDAGSNGGTPPMASTNAVMSQPEMSMSGGRDGNRAFGPAGGVAAASAGGPPPVRMRSRTNTIGSLRRNSSRTSIQPPPVVWGPHQHLANNANGRDSPGPSVPPSPSSAIGHPQPFRNREGMRSDPRIASFRSSDLSIASPAPTHGPDSNGRYTDALRHPHTSHGESAAPAPGWTNENGGTGDRPHTAFGDPIRENHSRRTLSSAAVKSSDPKMTTHVEGQSAEICDGSTSSPPKSPVR